MNPLGFCVVGVVLMSLREWRRWAYERRSMLRDTESPRSRHSCRTGKVMRWPLRPYEWHEMRPQRVLKEMMEMEAEARYVMTIRVHRMSVQAFQHKI